MKNTILIKCSRTHSEVFKKEDVDKRFSLTKKGTIQDGEEVKTINKNYDKYDTFVLEPMFRFNEKGDNKLEEKDDLLFFRLYAIDRNSDPLFVKYVPCGYVTSNSLKIKFI